MNPGNADAVSALQEAVLADPNCVRILDALELFDLPDAWLAAGAVFQNVWNARSGFPAGTGIRDYDVFYFDPDNLSWAAEDAEIRRFADVLPPGSPRVEVRNQARVHLWYGEKFGTDIPPFTSTADAVGAFAAFACSVAVRRAKGAFATASLELCAPYGLRYLFDMRLTPNKRLAPEPVYLSKAREYQRRWPLVRVDPW